LDLLSSFLLLFLFNFEFLIFLFSHFLIYFLLQSKRFKFLLLECCDLMHVENKKL
jgi:hypothetical protein